MYKEYKMTNILTKIGKALISALLTESVIKKLIILLLEKLAKKTDNSVDDEILKIVKDALKA